MSYKLICIDMDGTLLDDNKEVSKENIEVIKEAHEKKGVNIAICTGRLFANARYYSDLLGLKTPVIASNGAYIREKDRDEVVYKCLLEYENSKKVLDIISKYNLNVFFNTYDTIITNKEIQDSNAYLKFNKTASKDKQIKFNISKDLYVQVEKYKEEILKCICISDNSQELNKVKEEILKLNDLEVVSSFYDNFEIMKKGVSKGRGVEVLASYYGISKEEIICIGDNENDMSMIKYAGLGIAMGNATAEVKKEANYVTVSNNDSGVAKAIKKFILSE